MKLYRTALMVSCRFEGVSDVYQTVADNPVLGKEQPGARKRGKDVEDVVTLLAQGDQAGKS